MAEHVKDIVGVYIPHVSIYLHNMVLNYAQRQRYGFSRTQGLSSL
jgi:hypothetical protein